MGAFRPGLDEPARTEILPTNKKHGFGGAAVTEITDHPRGSKGDRVRRRFSCLTPIAHQPRFVAIPVTHFFGLALVVQLLAAPERDGDLGPAFGVEIDAERNDGHAFALDAFGKL